MFSILLFGYAVDGGEVHVVDLAAGEEVPDEILAALSDGNITKWAFNSNFERICLSEWLRRKHPEYFSSYGMPGDTVGAYLDPHGWKCSMIWSANPNIVRFWWDVDRAVKKAVKQGEPSMLKGIRFECRSGMLFIILPSGRKLAYVKPRMGGKNRFGGESVTYEGVGATKKWERIESYGPKFVEHIVQAISRDILCHAMKTLSHCRICAHVHDEMIIECGKDVSLDAVCGQMGRTPPWAEGLVMDADGYETAFYKKS